MDDDGGPGGVDAPASCPAGQLRIVTGLQCLVCLSGELGEAFQHHRTRRHVDAKSKSLGREDEFDQPGGE